VAPVATSVAASALTHTGLLLLLFLGVVMVPYVAACCVVALLDRAGYLQELGMQHVHVRMHDAVVMALAELAACGLQTKPTAALDSGAVSPRCDMLQCDDAEAKATRDV
jgi:hypothetical protein